MPPIPIHSNSPISATKAKEQATPQTDQQAASNAAPDATTTAPQAPVQAAYPPAKPGQPPVPAPTSTSHQSYEPYQPPPTRTSPLTEPDLKSDGPPPPQPGPVPSTQPQPTAQSYQPPPQSYQPPSQSYQPPNPTVQPSEPKQPDQLTMASLLVNQAPTHSTSTAYPPAPNSLQPQTLPATTQTGSADLSHPPGYQQDPNAAQMTPAQLAAQEQSERDHNMLARFSDVAAGTGSTNPAMFASNTNPAMGGSLGNESSAQSVMNSGAEMGGAAWDAAKKFMGGVAEKVGEMEGEVWKRVNGDK